MKKPLLCLLLSLLLLLPLPFPAASAQEGFETDGDVLLSCSLTDSTITVPDSVKVIAPGAFENNKTLREIILPDGLVSIEFSAFAGCENLTLLHLPQTLEKIDAAAFSGCVGLREISFPDALCYIGADAFLDTAWWNERPDGPVYAANVLYGYRGTMPENTGLTVKEGTVCIAAGAFYECENLTSVLLPDSLRIIGSYAFFSCTNLEELEVSEYVEIIESDAFSGCDNLRIRGKQNAPIQRYALENDIPFSATGILRFPKKASYVSGFFTDVTAADWFEASVAGAYEFGLMKGVEETLFSPFGNITLAEAVTMGARAHNIYMGDLFEFVQGEVWYEVYVDYAITNGIIAEDDFTDFSRPATRAEMVYIFAGSVPPDELAPINEIRSVPDVSPYGKYSRQILSLYRAGVLTGGDEAGNFYPESPVTRAEAAAIIARIADRRLRKTFSLD